MKKFLFVSILAVSSFFFAGCGSNDDVVIVDPGPGPGYVTLFLVDNSGFGIQYVPYACYAPDGSIVANDTTWVNGEFTFVPGDRCEFDLFGFNGSAQMPIFITDDLGYGKYDIPYECDNGDDFTNGTTDLDGYFDYPVDAYCKFYL